MLSRPLHRLRAEIIDAALLIPEHRLLWRDLASRHPELDAPSFDPEFVCSLAEYVADCRIAILHRGSRVVGYVPFALRKGEKVGRPIPMCDYQVVVVEPGTAPDVRELMLSLGLRSWHVENLPILQQCFMRVPCSQTTASPRVVLRAGYQAYVDELSASGRSGKNVRTKLRLLERDHGPISLRHGVRDDDALERLLHFKAERFAVSGVFEPWIYRALGRFHRLSDGPVTGHLSVVKAGESEVAYLFCLKRGALLYYWFPTFNPAFRKYSPGIISLWLLIRDLPSLGCDRLDLGPGGETYKAYFANAELRVVTGEVDANSYVMVMRRTYRRILQSARGSAVTKKCVKPIARWLQRCTGA
jgi:CelD/BcsL family acetyltransferase involved in cellulose biosynthesis